MRFTEYVTRFVRLASRYEEEITGTTTFGYPSAPFTEIPGRPPKLGSGMAFADESNCLKELVANAHRIEAWRKTNSYNYLVMVCSLSILQPFLLLITTMLEDYSKYQANTAIKGFDVLHQLFRLRYTKNMQDSEALAIMRSLAEGVKGYDQVVEVNLFHSHHASCVLKGPLAYGIATCLVAPWRGAVIPRIFFISSEGGRTRTHC